MNLADLLKKNIVMVPVVASVLVGTFTGVRYIVNLTDTINSNQQEIISLQRDLKVAEDKITDQNTRLTSAESTWQMAANLYSQLADKVREHNYDIKDLNRSCMEIARMDYRFKAILIIKLTLLALFG